MPKQRRPRRSAAMRLLPEPRKGSSTTSPDRVLFLTIASMSRTGFEVGCSAETLGLGQVLPGPNALNAAIMVGDRFHGTAGAIAAPGAMFGGPLGAAVYGAFNTYRLGRLSRDLAIIVAIAAVAYFAMFQMHSFGVLDPIATLLGREQQRSYSLLLRALGLLCFGAIYLLHRRFFRAAQVGGVEGKAGWLPGIAGILIGAVADHVFVSWLIEHH